VTQKDGGAKDTGADTNSDANTSDTGGKEGGGKACTPDKALVLVPWEPPSSFHQGKCSSAQTSLYATDWAGNDTAGFRADPKNATCLTCIETSPGASMHGPVITSEPNFEANFGGCTAHFDGNDSPTGCGALVNEYQTCAYTECGDCLDYGTDGPMVMKCLTAATSKGGVCKPYLSLSCEAELDKGGVAADCANLGDFLFLWCGSSSDAGGD
jgi:hypothetical protein